MTTDQEWALEPDDEEYLLLTTTLRLWDVAKGQRLVAPLVGVAVEGFSALTHRLRHAIEAGESMTAPTWIRILFLAEISLTSAVLGASTEYSSYVDAARQLAALRDLQARLRFPDHFRPQLLTDNALKSATNASRSARTLVHPAELVQVNLTDDERSSLLSGLLEWCGPSFGDSTVAPMVGLDSEERLHKYVFSLLDRLKSHDPLTELDWIRAMLLAELCWGSCILGAASDYPTIFRYEPSLAAIRSLQRKIVTDERIELLIDNALPMVRPER